ncbi:hypothetical protein U1Q18_024769 [Sarracenia purpurea var. burkii]
MGNLPLIPKSFAKVVSFEEAGGARAARVDDCYHGEARKTTATTIGAGVRGIGEARKAGAWDIASKVKNPGSKICDARGGSQYPIGGHIQRGTCRKDYEYPKSAIEAKEPPVLPGFPGVADLSNTDGFLDMIEMEAEEVFSFIVGIVGGLLGLLLFGCLLLLVWKGRHKGYKREAFVDVAGEVDRRIASGQLKRFAWGELKIASE